MPHIAGHIITPPQSCGVLRVDKSNVKLFHLPNNWKMKKNQKVGFLPMTMKGIGMHQVLGSHVYKFSDYDDVEKMVAQKVHVKNLEKLHDNAKGLKTMRAMAKNPKLSRVHREILVAVLDYFKSNDFRKFYIKKTTVPIKTAMRNKTGGAAAPKSGGLNAHTSHAITKISSIMR